MRKLYAILFLLLCAPAFGQTLTVDPPSAPAGAARLGKLTKPELPAGAIKLDETLTLEGGTAKEIGELVVYWPTRTGKAQWECNFHVQVFEAYLAFAPDFDPKKPWTEQTDKLIPKSRLISDTPGKFVAAVDVVVDGPQPDPKPDPKPDPQPQPVPGNFSAQVRVWLKALPPGAYSKATALAVADNYLTIGSQGSDSARNQGWDAATFGERMKALNFDTLGADGIDVWREPFFRPLAAHQAKLVTDRNIQPTDIAKIAALWTETGEAIKAAAY